MRMRLRLGLDLAALLLIACGLLVTLAVITYDPADPPGGTVFPHNLEPANLFGTTGATAAHYLIETFGLSVYAIIPAWFVIVFLLLLQGRRGDWCWRVLGWLLIVPSVALAGDCLGSSILDSPLTSPGGNLGAALHQFLSFYLTPTGVWLVAAAALLGGVGFAGDFIWPALFFRMGRWLDRYRAYRAQRRVHAIERAKLRREAAEREAAAQVVPIQHPSTDETLQAPAAVVETAATETATTAPEPPPIVYPPTVLTPPPVKRPAPMPSEMPANDYQLPPFDLLEDPAPFPYDKHDQELRERAAQLEKIFTDFDLNVHVVGINTGPVITQYEVALETGLRLHKVTRLADDLALNLKVPSVRMVAPIPGKNTVGIEIPNEHRAMVRLKEVILGAGFAAGSKPAASDSWASKAKIPLFFGKDTEGRPLVYDLADMPHLLIAGRTGTGKSVCMNAIILSILMTRRPNEVRMIMIDPKMLELSEYGKIPHLMHPVVKDMKKAEAILAWAVDKMEERYDLLSRARVRSIAGYNELGANEIYRRVRPLDDDERARTPERMPYIVIFVDEMNDLMMTMRKEVEGHIIRLAQKSRAAGIHLVVATQKPTVDVITGLIKSNLPARICFQVSSRSDSRVVLDEMGAEKLLGKGDMLFLQPGTSTILRAQGAYASDKEISQVVEYLECEPAYSRELIHLSTSASGGRQSPEALRARDELYEQAIEIVLREGRGSVSLLQRALGIGYGRAARLIDFMAEDAIVGPYNGSNAREVLVTLEQWEQMKQPKESGNAA